MNEGEICRFVAFFFFRDLDARRGLFRAVDGRSRLMSIVRTKAFASLEGLSVDNGRVVDGDMSHIDLSFTLCRRRNKSHGFKSEP